MLSFYGGGNPFAQDPTRVLSQMAEADNPAPGAAPISTVPPAPAAAPVAAAPAGAPSPAPASNFAGTLSAKLGDMMSGRGLFGGSPDDAEIDPATGAPKGMARQQGMRSMMQMGLLFLAAGQRMSDDQRAAILSKAPGLVGGSDDAMNTFAKSRLEMAKLKLAERQQLAEEASNKTITDTVRQAMGGAAPSAGAQAVTTAQQGNAATGEAIGAPVAATPAPSPSPDNPTGTPVQGFQIPGAPPRIAAPGGVPRSGFTLSPAAGAAILSRPTVAGKAEALGGFVRDSETRQAQREDQETEGSPVWNPQVQRYETPVMRRGAVVRMKEAGNMPVTTRDFNGMRQKGYYLPDGNFHVTEQTEIGESPSEKKDRETHANLAASDREGLMKNYQENIQRSLTSYDKMREIREQVRDGKGIFGTQYEARKLAANALATMGYLTPEQANDQNVSANFERALKDGVQTVIKGFNGSTQVSDSDRKFAQEVMQAAASNNRSAVINALNNGMQDVKDSIGRHNENVDRHNGNLEGFGDNTKKRLVVPRVDRDFLNEEDEIELKRQGKVPGEAAKPESGTVQFVRDANGKLVRAK